MGTIPPAQPAQPAVPPVTPTGFLEEYPLYRVWNGKWSTPGTISRDCRQLGKETTWKFGGNLGNSQGSFKMPFYQCVKRQGDTVYFLIVETWGQAGSFRVILPETMVEFEHRLSEVGRTLCLSSESKE